MEILQKILINVCNKNVIVHNMYLETMEFQLFNSCK